jgi:hypothetical protein
VVPVESVTGLGKFTCCQPLAVSVVEVVGRPPNSKKTPCFGLLLIWSNRQMHLVLG